MAAKGGTRAAVNSAKASAKAAGKKRTVLSTRFVCLFVDGSHAADNVDKRQKEAKDGQRPLWSCP